MKLFTRRNRKKLMNKLVKIGALMVLIVGILGSSLQGVSATSMSGGVVSEKIIGIDLGTTQSVLAYSQNGNTIIIPNEQGNRLTPSIVSFKGNEILVGDSAYNTMTTNSRNTLFDVKRFIGRNFNDPSVQKDMKLLPFEVINKDNRPYFKVNYKGTPHEFSAEEISSMVLKKLKQTAESYLGEEVKKAVITVPAYFDDAQKAATRDAGTIAGLDVVRIINEPTSAAIAYGIDKHHLLSNKEMNIIVYDLGGGTFDVSLLTLDDGIFEVQANNGDTHLGGEDFDENVLKFMMKRFNKKTGIDIRNNDRALSKLRKECEKAKRALSSTKEIKIEIENLADGQDFSELLTRARFEDLNNKLFRRTLKPLEQILNDSGFKKNEIDEIVLVGGSTRIPKIQELVCDFFNGKEANRGINPDEAVAFGAALQACLIGNHCGDNIIIPPIIDTTSLSLGIETVGEIFTKIIEKNTNFPIEKSKIFSTHTDNQDSVLIKIFQGERGMVKDNIKLGEFLLSGIAPSPRGIPQIEVKFEIDINGLLNVEAFDKSSGNKQSLEIKKDGLNLDEKTIKNMINEAEEREEEDKLIIQRTNGKNHFESSVYSLKNKVYDKKDELDENNYDILMELINESIEWLDDNIDNAQYDDFIEKQQEFDEIVGQIFSNNNNNNSGYHNQDSSTNDDNSGYDYSDHQGL